MGEFPVISVSFRSVEGTTINMAVSLLMTAISELYSQYLFLADSPAQNASDKKYFKYVYEFCKLKKVSSI